MAFAVQAFQSSARLAPTGRLDAETLEALGSSDAHFAYLPPASRGYETWMPMKKFKKGKWKVKWKGIITPSAAKTAITIDRQIGSPRGTPKTRITKS